jgi:hypothetical protein
LPCRRSAELTERESLFYNAIGAVWLAYIGGAIGFRDAERLADALKRAARLPQPIEPRVHLASEA